MDLLDAHVFADPDDIFEREALVATFKAGNFDFTVVAIHIKPDDADAELAALTRVTTSLLV